LSRTLYQQLEVLAIFPVLCLDDFDEGFDIEVLVPAAEQIGIHSVTGAGRIGRFDQTDQLAVRDPLVDSLQRLADLPRLVLAFFPQFLIAAGPQDVPDRAHGCPPLAVLCAYALRAGCPEPRRPQIEA